MTAGLRIIEGLINGGILQSFCAHCKDHDIVTSFNINAAEQIEALVWDVLGTPCPQTISEDTPIGEILKAASPMKAAVLPQPNGCTCYGMSPTVPVFRDPNDHLAGCPAGDIEAMKRVMSKDAQMMRKLQEQVDRLHFALDGAKTERDEARENLDEERDNMLGRLNAEKLRREEAEAALAAVGDMAVADWNNEVVGMVDAVVKEPLKYKDQLRTLFGAQAALTAALEKDRDKAQADAAVMREALSGCRNVLQMAKAVTWRAMVGSCNCMTKAPAPQYHSEQCRYREAAEVSEAIDAKIPQADAALARFDRVSRSSQ